MSFTKYWAQDLHKRMGFVERRASTAAKVSVTDFEERRAQFLFDIQVLIMMEEIPNDLLINWDLYYVPTSNCTMAKEVKSIFQ